MEYIIEPMVERCREDILMHNPSYKLSFQIDNYKYIISIPEPYDSTYINKISPTLTLDELNGAEDGIYTWILIDTGIGSEKEIFVKKNINITEISTKHLDILKSICSNEQYTDNSRPLPETLRIYFGGELSKTTNITGEIIYNINLLSGSYSLDRISPTDLSEVFKRELKILFILGLFNDSLPNINVNILETTETLIRIGKTKDERENFERTILSTYCQNGVKMYRFDTSNPVEKEFYLRTLPNTKFKFETQKDILLRQYENNTTSHEYLTKLKVLEEKYGPLKEEELGNFELKPLSQGNISSSFGGKKTSLKRIKKKNTYSRMNNKKLLKNSIRIVDKLERYKKKTKKKENIWYTIFP